MLRPFGSVWKDAAAFVFGGPVLSVLYNWEVCPAQKAGERDYCVGGPCTSWRMMYSPCGFCYPVWVCLVWFFACIATDTMRIHVRTDDGMPRRLFFGFRDGLKAVIRSDGSLES